MPVTGIGNCLTYSCEPSIGCKRLFPTSSMISQVQVYYVGRAINGKATLTQAYDWHLSPSFHVSPTDSGQSLAMHINMCSCDPLQEKARLDALELVNRSAALLRQFGVECTCGRCIYETRNSVNHQVGGYFLAFACPLAPKCTAPVIRSPVKSTPETADTISGFKCAASECPGKLSSRKVKELYGSVTDCLFQTIPALFGGDASLIEEHLLCQVLPILSRLHDNDFLASLHVRLAVLLATRGLLKGALHSTNQALAIREKLDEKGDSMVTGNMCTILLNCLVPALERIKKEKEPKVNSPEQQEMQAIVEKIRKQQDRVNGRINYGLKITMHRSD